ncbi:hypothetical protein [Lewinella cohaerens]|uniref:hypothetical protein n=1 Tax=Lewinella cohaerens TaxID=70995 RepID=UPI00037750F2|nr:hypothetical protein [Lewinella cohaerens]
MREKKCKPSAYLVLLLVVLTACGGAVPDEQETTTTAVSVPDTFAYRQYLPVGMDLQLTEGTIDTLTGDSVEFENANLFLGYRSGIKHNTTQNLLLNFNGEENITFADLARVLEGVKAKVLANERGRIVLNLWVDARVPYFVLDYLQLQIRREHLLSISYPLADGLQLWTKLPPFSDNECMNRSKRPCLHKPLLSADKQKILNDNGLQANWAPTYRYEEFVLKEENLFTIYVNSGNQLVKDEQLIEQDSITPRAQRFLESAPAPYKIFFQVKVKELATSASFLQTFGSLKQMYEQVWENASQATYGQPRKDLIRKDEISLRSKYPIVIMVEQVP